MLIGDNYGMEDTDTGEYFSNEPQMCPQGCGRTTEDPYGGPCQHCWNALDDDDLEDDLLDTDDEL